MAIHFLHATRALPECAAVGGRLPRPSNGHAPTARSAPIVSTASLPPGSAECAMPTATCLARSVSPVTHPLMILEAAYPPGPRECHAAIASTSPSVIRRSAYNVFLACAPRLISPDRASLAARRRSAEHRDQNAFPTVIAVSSRPMVRCAAPTFRACQARPVETGRAHSRIR